MNKNQDKLEDIAYELVQRFGLKGLSLNALADIVGIEASNIRASYPDKTDLVQALIQRYTSQVFAVLSEIAGCNCNLRSKLERFIGIFDDQSGKDQLCLCAILAAELNLLERRNIESLSSFFGDLEHWLATLFETHKTEIKSSLPALHLAKVMLSNLEGTTMPEFVTSTTAFKESPLPSSQLAKVMVSGLEGAMMLDRVAGNTKCMDTQKKLFLSMVAG